jgi:hypothetical protein
MAATLSIADADIRREYQGEPVPSTMWPLVITRSKPGVGVCAVKGSAAARRMIARTRFRFRSFIGFPLCSLTATAKAHSKEQSLSQRASAAPAKIRLERSRPTVRERAQRDPDGEHDPFVNRKMTGNFGDHFHQHHGDRDQQSQAGNQRFHSRRFR